MSREFVHNFIQGITWGYGIRLWQVASQGYAQSISLLMFLLKYQSPTASAIRSTAQVHEALCRSTFPSNVSSTFPKLSAHNFLKPDQEAMVQK